MMSSKPMLFCIRSERAGFMHLRSTQSLTERAKQNIRVVAPFTKVRLRVARQAEQRMGNFNAQGLANTAWAFATAGQTDAQLFAALAREAE